MRTVTRDEKYLQVQVDDEGTEYHYEKYYVPKGDGKTEYCLVLRHTFSLVNGEAFKTFVGLEKIESKHFIVIQWPGVKS